MSRPLALLLGLPLFTACDDDPCTDASGNELCTGVIAVDLASDPPLITLHGAGAVFPDRLTVVRWREGSECGSAVGTTVWEVEQLSRDAVPLSYGVVPAGARERIPARRLVEEADYEVTFWASDAGLSSTATSHGEWGASFTWGDPESVQTQSDACR